MWLLFTGGHDDLGILSGEAIGVEGTIQGGPPLSRRSCLRLSIRTGSTIIIVGVGRSLLIMLMMSVEYSREWSTQRPSSIGIGLHEPTLIHAPSDADAAATCYLSR